MRYKFDSHFVLRFTNVMDPAITREVSVAVNYENRRRYGIHFHSGTGVGKGFVLKFTGNN